MKVDIKYLLLFILTLIFLTIIGGKLLTVIFIVLFITLIVSLFIFNIYESALNVRLKSGRDKITVNTEDKYAVEIRNNLKIMVPDVRVETKKDGKSTLLNIVGNSTKRIEYPFFSKVRGIFKPDSLKITFSDIFNIFTSVKEIDFKEIRVYPVVFDELENSPINDYLGEGKIQRNYNLENPYVSRDLRKYVPGDNIRKINWKVSAKHNELIVRKDEVSEEKKVIILLDMNKGILLKDETGEYENKLVSDALTLSRELMNKEVIHVFIFNNNTMEKYNVENEDDHIKVVERSIEIKADSDSTLLDYAYRRKADTFQSNTYFVFTIFSEENLNALASLKTDRNKVVVFTPTESFNEFTSRKSNLDFYALKGGEYGEI